MLSTGACHQNDRDRTREFLISWVQLVAIRHLDNYDEVGPFVSLYWQMADIFILQDLSYSDLILQHYDKIDTFGDGNGFVDADEWLRYFTASKTNWRHNSQHHHHNRNHNKKKAQLEKLRCVYHFLFLVCYLDWRDMWCELPSTKSVIKCVWKVTALPLWSLLQHISFFMNRPFKWELNSSTKNVT